LRPLLGGALVGTLALGAGSCVVAVAWTAFSTLGLPRVGTCGVFAIWAAACVSFKGATGAAAVCSS